MAAEDTPSGEGRPLVFYCNFPLGYHNPEQETKARGFARNGYHVTYVVGLGVRNPRLSSLAKLKDRIERKVRSIRDAPTGTADELASAAVLVLPPRQVPWMCRFNSWWLERQLRSAVHDWSTAVVWVRWPTPELVEALKTLQPAAVVYECVDAYHLTSGITGRWREIHDRAERSLVELASAVVVPGEVLAERFRPWGANVHVVPHGVHLFPAVEHVPPGDEPVVGLIGTLDFRLDVPLLRHMALSHPEWQLKLFGPVQEGFDPQALADLSNVTIGPPVPYASLGDTLSTFDAGMIPYVGDEIYRSSVPVKALEFLAAGLPTVVRSCPALQRYDDVLYSADSPESFVTQLERALKDDSPERAERRRAAVEGDTWDERVAQCCRIVADLVVTRPPPGRLGERRAGDTVTGDQPDVSIVIVTWRARDHVLRCLESIERHADMSHETIVVDDGSGDGTPEAVERQFPWARVVAKPVNEGLPAGRNTALPLVTGRLVLMLDSDTELRPGALSAMARVLDARPEVGLVGPKLLYPDGELQLSCRRYPPLLLPLLRRGPYARLRPDPPGHRRHLMTDDDHEAERPVVWVAGAAQMWRSELAARIGRYDLRVSSYGGEDLDWCLRTWAAELEVRYVPNAHVVHVWQRVTHRNKYDKKSFRTLRDFYYLQWKHRRLRGDRRLAEANR